MIDLILLLLAGAWIVHALRNQYKGQLNLPGPPNLPLVGSLFSMSRRMYMDTVKWNNTYGPQVYFNVFNKHFVAVSDLKLVKELFSMDKLSGRPIFEIFMLYEGEQLGIVLSEGNLWEVHRRFTLRNLRDFGFGKRNMEGLIMDEVHDLCKVLKSTNGRPVGGIKRKFALAVVNSLWTVVAGNRFSQNDERLYFISAKLEEMSQVAAKSGAILLFLPWLRHILPEWSGYKASRAAFDATKKIITDAVEEHKRTFQQDTCRDFIDVYLREVNTTKDPDSTFTGTEGMKQLTVVMADLFLAGSDTTSTTLAWTILYLVTHPEVQKKLQAEISAITGDSRDVSVADRPNMPYLQAVIEEVLRRSSIVPGGVGHTAMIDVTHKGVTYKKGTTVMINAYHIHHNPKIWGDPDNFRPERFLSSDEKTFKKSEYVVAFSVGRRQCLGETLARDSLFLFTGNLFQKFNVLCSPGPQPNLEPEIGIGLSPQEFLVMFKTRSEE